jgi:hypothetical protein
VLAALHRLTLGRAVRALGLSGGGPERRFGRRGQLLLHLRHTRAVGALVAATAAALRRASTPRAPAVLLDCRSTGACAAGPFQPDALLRYRYRGRVRELFVELEHGTARGAEGYPRKFDRYHTHYAENHLVGDRYAGPTVVVVVDHHRDRGWAADPRRSDAYRRAHSERLLERIAGEVRAADARAGRRLPVRLTTLLRALGHPEKLGGPVWSGAHRATPRRLPLLPIDPSPLLAGRSSRSAARTHDRASSALRRRGSEARPPRKLVLQTVRLSLMRS